MKTLVAIFTAAIIALFAAPALAHKASDAYLAIDASSSTVDVRWEIAVRDLDLALAIDGDGDGAVRWGELRTARPRIAQLAQESLHIRGDGAACMPQGTPDLALTSHTDGAYAQVRVSYMCSARPRALALDYTLLFGLDPQHKGLARIDAGGATHTVTFTRDARAAELTLATVDRAAQLASFVRLGVKHIWEGIDHLLFLLALLLPSVLRREGKGWAAVPALRPAIADVLRIVTAFTLAHSITLSLAVLDVVRPPSGVIEAAIAVSVAVAAIDNVRPILGGRRWLAAFALGLLHGFGFSSALTEMALSRGDVAIALFGFNAGVELGQCAAVALFLPLAYALRKTRAYRWGALTAGSVAIGLVAIVWTVERIVETVRA
jgi:hypothetical protein